MKLAFVGKGGSGKSTTSWLFSEFLSQKYSVLAIDADHNMDLASIYGMDVSESTKTFHRLHDRFRAYVGLEEDKNWARIVLENDNPARFSIEPQDAYTKELTHSVKPGLSLQIVGLGADDILYSDRCAHGHSAPLKFYLALLNEGDHQVIVDAVAGSDMVNFGLFNGADMMIGVVEPHINSVKVFGQLKTLADRLEIPMYGIMNKPRQNELYKRIYGQYGEDILGEIPFDQGIIDYEFSSISQDTLQALEDIWSNIKFRYTPSDKLERLREFEQKRLAKKS